MNKTQGSLISKNNIIMPFKESQKFDLRCYKKFNPILKSDDHVIRIS